VDPLAARPLDGDTSSHGVSIVDADMNILFVATVAVIAPDPAQSRKLYVAL
jgi:hypothetical protein